MVGERGPEMFVPESAGMVNTNGSAIAGCRRHVTVNDANGGEPNQNRDLANQVG
jgi:hypothetical protein